MSAGSIDGFVPTKQEAPELSVVMPCLNEVKTLGVCIEKAQACMAREGIRGEIVIADNGSTDGSQELAERLGARLVHVEERGYGSALYWGITAAKGRFVIMGDSDDSYDFSNMLPIVEQLRAGHDLVMGNRFLGGIEAGAMPAMHRYFGNPLLTFIGRVFFRTNCGDFYCGQRGFTKDAFKRMQLRSGGMEFALEMLVKATMLGMKVTEVPVTLSPDGRDRAPHLRRWRDGWRSLRFYLLYSPKWLFLYPGLAIVLVGCMSLSIGGQPGEGSEITRWSPVTLILAASAIISGAQMLGFSLLGKVAAIATGLHPRPQKGLLDYLFRRIHLEKGLLTGALILLIGVVPTVLTVAGWSSGDLSRMQALQRVIPALVVVGFGLQVMGGSFLLALMKLPLMTRKYGASSDGRYIDRRISVQG